MRGRCVAYIHTLLSCAVVDVDTLASTFHPGWYHERLFCIVLPVKLVLVFYLSLYDTLFYSPLLFGIEVALQKRHQHLVIWFESQTCTLFKKR